MEYKNDLEREFRRKIELTNIYEDFYLDLCDIEDEILHILDTQM